MSHALASLDILQRRTVSSVIEDEIVRMIKAGEVKAGDRLTEISFVERLGVSRPPVREAFRALGGAGLVKLEKHRGVFVREISEDEAAELYAMRAGFDEIAGRALAPRITRAQLDELEARLASLASTARTADIGAYFAENIAFHDRIVEMSGNRTLLEFYRRLVDRMHLLRSRSFAAAAGTRPSRSEHRAIVDALATRDAETAARALRHHVEFGYERMLATMNA